MQARFAGAVVLSVCGCGPASVGRPTEPPPQLARPSDAIPADLDVAIRIDLIAARRLFGARFSDALELGTVDAEQDPAGARLLSDALAEADTAWLAFRPGLRPELTDNVVVLRGHFGEIAPREYPGPSRWGPPMDLGADTRVFDRPDPGRRGAPRRLYARSDELLVLVSEAEIDSVERAVERHAGDPHLDPPDRGAVSLAVRLPPVLSMLSSEFPAVAEVLERASELSGHATVDGVGMNAEVEIRFEDTAAAERAQRAAGQLIRVLAAHPSPFGLVAKAARPAVVVQTLVVRIAMDPKAFGQVVACADNRTDCW